MEHVINANYGDVITIHIPNKPKVAFRQITIPAVVDVIKSNQQMLEDICAALGITVLDVQGKSRTSELTNARFYLCYRLHQTGATLKSIGTILNRDHTTIIHAIRTHIARVEYKDKETLKIVNAVEQYENAENKTEL